MPLLLVAGPEEVKTTCLGLKLFSNTSGSCVTRGLGGFARERRLKGLKPKIVEPLLSTHLFNDTNVKILFIDFASEGPGPGFQKIPEEINDPKLLGAPPPPPAPQETFKHGHSTRLQTSQRRQRQLRPRPGMRGHTYFGPGKMANMIKVGSRS